MIIRDPIHGDIEVTRLQGHLLDAPEVQRLREIRQTGAACLVYPGCVHTRFEHSLGCLAAANRLMNGLARAGHALARDEREVVGCAALLHDVTHIPFGHTFEDERTIFPRHDDGHRFGRFFEDGELGRRLRAAGLDQPMRAWFGPTVGADRASAGATTGAAGDWRFDLVSGCVDADLLDYLRRDARFAGLVQDYDDRVYHAFVVEDGRLVVNLLKHDMDRPDVRSEIVHVLRLRYFLTERVYLHHAKLSAGAMVSKAVELAAAAGLPEEAMYELGDATFFAEVGRFLSVRGETAGVDLLQAVRERRLYKRAFVASTASIGAPARDELIARFGDRRRRLAFEVEVAAAAGCRPHEVILCCPPRSLFKEADVPVRHRGGVTPLSRLGPALLGEVAALRQQYEDLWRLHLFAPAEVVDRVAEAATRALGIPSEYRRTG